MELGQRIRQLRRQHGFTQRVLAKRAGVDVSYLSKIENGRLEHTPSIKTLQDLAAALSVDELELMDLADKVPPVLDVIARDKDALRFFRRATAMIKSPEGWRDLLAYLDRQDHPGLRTGFGNAASPVATEEEEEEPNDDLAADETQVAPNVAVGPTIVT